MSERGRVLKTGDSLMKSGETLSKKGSNWQDERMKKVADILHKQAVKEEAISPKLKNFIRAVVYGSQQVNNLNYSINGNVGNSLRDGDCVVLIDVWKDMVYMKKSGYDPIEFSLKDRTITAHGWIFDVGCGEIKGISDNVDVTATRVDFTVSERVIGEIIEDINMIKDKIDVIIQMLGDIEAQIDAKYGQLVDVLGVMEGDIEQKISDETGALGVKIDVLDSSLSEKMDLMEGDIEQRIDSVDSNLNTVFDELSGKIDGLDSSLSNRMDGLSDKIDTLDSNLADKIAGVYYEVGNRTGEISARCENIYGVVSQLASTVDNNYNTLKEELDEIKALVQQLIP